MSGKFVVFEGVDNSGKTTVATRIKEWLESRKVQAILTKHPGSTAVGQELRQILKHSEHPIDPNSQALLFAADNSLFINNILKPAKKTGCWILCDRNNFISSLAYQIASGCDFDHLDNVHAATGNTEDTKIDVLFVFYCSWENTKLRKSLAGDEVPDRYEDQGRDYFNKLHDCYDKLLSEQSGRLQKFVKDLDNVHYIDANRTLDEVIGEIKGILEVNLRG
tara:strand:- start:54260 stop:54922 length:663 start_codon:yes stop_codon:yes gene_type:complete